MSKRRILTTIVLVLALTGTGYALFQQTGQNLTFYYEVDEVDRAEIGDRRIKISGIVADESVSRVASEMRTTFAITGPTSRIDVAYTGPLPDIFKPGIQVVAEGSFDAGGTLVADDLMAKCPSKYQPSGNPDDFAHLDGHPDSVPRSTVE